MTYSLEFDARALKEWQKLGDTIRQQLKKKLVSVLLNPRVEANRLHSLPDCYKMEKRGLIYLSDRHAMQVAEDRLKELKQGLRKMGRVGCWVLAR